MTACRDGIFGMCTRFRGPLLLSLWPWGSALCEKIHTCGSWKIMVSWSFVDSAGKPFAFYRCSVPGFSGFLNRSTPVSCSLPEFGLSLCLSPPCARHCFHRKSCAFSTMCTLKAKRFRRKFALCKPDARSRITRLFRIFIEALKSRRKKRSCALLPLASRTRTFKFDASPKYREQSTSVPGPRR